MVLTQYKHKESVAGLRYIAESWT